MTAIGCQAQEADATKTARYNNRHTMDGYKAFYEAGYFWGIDDTNGPHLPNKFSVTTSQGFQLNNFVYFGIGAGIDSYRHNENCYISVPLFADLRVNCLNDKRVMPFFDIRMGYSMGDRARGFLLGEPVGREDRTEEASRGLCRRRCCLSIHRLLHLLNQRRLGAIWSFWL